MAKIYQPITACLKKTSAIDEGTTQSDKGSSMDKKNDDATGSSSNQPGWMWKVSSGLYNVSAGAIGLGVGGMKWAATTTYNVGSGVLSATQNVASKVTHNKQSKTKNE